MDDLNIFDDSPEQNLPTEGGLSRLGNLYRKWKELEDRRSKLEAELTVANEELNFLVEVTFPELFDEVGVSEFSVDGVRISVDQKLYGSLPKEEFEREEALDELLTHGGGDIIKPTVTVPFARSGREEALKLGEYLKASGLTYELKEDVNHMTYKSWAKEELENGTPLDLKRLGIWSRRFVKETKHRVKKGK